VGSNKKVTTSSDAPRQFKFATREVLVAVESGGDSLVALSECGARSKRKQRNLKRSSLSILVLSFRACWALPARLS
jgi:hypothetical protein